jgi:PAS domain S-box-containing protein
MKLGTRMALHVALVIATALLVALTMSTLTMLHGFWHIEERDVRRDVERVHRAIEERQSTVLAAVLDWSKWDDTYAYVQDRNTAYEQTYLNAAQTFADLRIDVLLILDTADQPVWGGGFDSSAARRVPLPADVLGPPSPLARLSTNNGQVAGLILLDAGPLLVASSPILKSDGAGPARGTLVMGRWLDETAVRELADSTGVDLAMRRADAIAPGEPHALAVSALAQGRAADVRVLKPDTVAGYGLIRDLADRPALLAEVRRSREVHRQALETIALLVAGTVGMGIALAAIAILAHRKQLISRLESLHQQVGQATSSLDSRGGVTVPGDDEVTELADGINRILAKSRDVQRALADSQRQYETLFREMLVGFAVHEIICDAAGEPVDYRFLAVNPAFERLTGLRAADIVGRTVLEVLPQTERYWIIMFGQVALTGQPASFGNFSVALNKHFEVSAFSPAPGRFACTVADITERVRTEARVRDLLEESRRGRTALLGILEDQRRADEASRAARDYLDRVLNSLADPVFVKDRQRRFVLVNDAECQLLGRRRDELLGQTDDAFLPAEQTQVFRQRDEAVFEAGGPDVSEEQLTDAQGVERTIITKKTLYVDPDGNRFVVGVSRDVTEHRKAEQAKATAMMQALRRYETVADLATSPCVATGSVDGLAQRLTELAARALGVERASIWLFNADGTTWRCVDLWEATPAQHSAGAVLSPQEHAGELQAFTETTRSIDAHDALHDPRTAASAASYLRPHGITSMLLTLIRCNGRSAGMLRFEHVAQAHRWDLGELSFADHLANHVELTLANHARLQAEAEREQVQDQLMQAQKMESIGRLAGGVAHDFNNLLMGIMGYIELCRDQVAKDHLIQEYLNEITADAGRSADLVRQLLAFARKQTIEPRLFDLNDAVAGMLKMLRRLLSEEINLTWVPGAAPAIVEMDPSQLHQILANLTVNARDAITGVGKVTIEARNVTCSGDGRGHPAEVAPGEYVLLTVSDTGSGMSQETMAHLFEPFFTTKALGEGTGLGLATVYGVVQQNHGAISVRSEVGHGTTFSVYLPRHPEAPTPPANNDTPPATETGGRETILLVEDEKSVRITVRAFLEGLGHTVLSAAAPEEALRLAAAQAQPIHLLITDVVLPDMSGRDLATRLAETRPGMRVLFMSGYTADVIGHRGVLDQGVAFLAKPFARADLARAVREVLA